MGSDAGNLVISGIWLHNFRSWRDEVWHFDNRKTLFVGRNGAGKSNLLEAIYYSSVLRSFRTASLKELYTVGEKFMSVDAMIGSREGFSRRIHIEQELNGPKKLFINNQPVRRSSDFINEFRAVAFAPEDKNITEGSSLYRRRFMDMLIGVLEREYLILLQNYTSALRSRNALLRSLSAGGMTDGGELDVFEVILADCGVKIGRFRTEYTGLLAEKLSVICLKNDGKNNGNNFKSGSFTLKYVPSFSLEITEYIKDLRCSRIKDMKRGYTSIGPQLDEWIISLDGRELRYYGSNGQLRLASLYLKLAEFSLVKERSALPVVALIDDVTCELDRENAESFIDALEDAEQMFFTFVKKAEFAGLAGADVRNI